MIRNLKKNYSWKKNLYFFDKNCNLLIPKASIEDVKATEKAAALQNVIFLWVSFAFLTC
jgi:hypothetical protein